MSKARDLADLGAVTSRLDTVGASDGALSNRNFIINGAFQVAQRGTSFASANGYTLDRIDLSFDVGAVTVTQNSVTDLSGFSYSYKVACTTTATSTGTNHNWFQYLMEGQDAQSWGFGQSGAKPLTLSFYAKSNNTDTRVLWFYNPASARHYAQTFSNTAANTWEKITISIPADTSGTITNSANTGFYIRFVLAAGPDYKNGIPSSGWVGVNNDRYQGVDDFLDSTSNYFEITGLQLEVGDTATPFEHRSYGDELKKCERYYQVYGNAGYAPIAVGINTSATLSRCGFTYRTRMRATPTIAGYNNLITTDRATINGPVTGISINGASDTAAIFDVGASAGGLTQYRVAMLTANITGSTPYFHLEAEL